VSRTLFGVRCPGCGLTDSFVAIGHGNIPAAFAANPLGPVLFALLALTVLTRIVKWRLPRLRGWRWVDGGLAAGFVLVLVARTIVYYAT
jgi:hypothetical protein